MMSSLPIQLVLDIGVKVYEHANYNALKTGKDKLLMGSTSNMTSVNYI